MPRSLSVLAFAATSLLACSDDEVVPPVPIDAAVDAAVDAAIDAPPGPCGADLQITGEYIDWDSTLASFDGVENTTWTVVSPAGGATAMTAPNGRILLCITRAATSQIDLTQAEYLPARFVADPAVFTPAGSLFSIRGVKTAMTAAQWTEFGQTYDASKAQVLIYKIGAPVPLALTPPVATAFVSDGDDDITWTAGSTGALTLFANVPIGGGSVTLGSTSTFTGPTALPVAAGRLTIAVIR